MSQINWNKKTTKELYDHFDNLETPVKADFLIHLFNNFPKLDITWIELIEDIHDSLLFMHHPEKRKKLHENAQRLKNGLRKLGLKTNESYIPVAAWKLNSSAEMKKVQLELFNRGIAIQYIQYVGAGTEGVLRVVVFSTHTSEQINRLLFELGRLV